MPHPPNPATPPLFVLAGGLDGLRAVVTTFYDAVFDDIMIGFHFRDADKARLIDKEIELAARMLGASHIAYTGKAMRPAHANHRILGGQFERRLHLLRKAMQTHNMPQAVQDAWVEHTRALRPLITDDVGSDCNHATAEARAQRLTSDEG